MYLDIQGLRCLAVVFVVLFHVWPKKFKSGFLGVDAFFVISGYLMFLILNGRELNSSTIRNFYFRRVSRIVPAYLFVLLTSAFTVYMVFPPELHQTTAEELLSAATFTSNFFNLPVFGYFAVNNKFPVFLHSWTLSVELQFYLLVPFLFFVFQYCERRRKGAGIGMIITVLFGSLAFQLINKDNINVSHMHLISRIWQFLIGFLVGYSSNPSNNSPKSNKLSLSTSSLSQIPCGILYQIKIPEFISLKNLLALCYLLQLATPISKSIEFNRTLCTVTTALFIYIRGPSILDHSWMVFIGDVSYSIYLVHWPLLVVHNYLNISQYYQLSWLDGSSIVQASFLLGIVLECSFKRLKTFTTDIRKLLAILFILYSSLILIGSMLSQSSQVDVHEPMNISSHDQFIAEMVKLFENRQNLNLTQEELIRLNKDIFDFVDGFNHAHIIERNTTSTLKVFHQIEGEGTLEMVIVGNSVAADLFFGIWGRMRKNFRRLTLYYSASIIPFHPDQEGDHPADFIELIMNFDRPIDVLIVRHTHRSIRRNKEYIKKKMRKEVAHFYGNLSLLSPKHIIVSLAEYDSNFNYQQFWKWIERRGSTDVFNFSLRESEQKSRALDRVLTSINCPKCCYINFSRRLCDAITDICTVVDKNGIAYYRDSHHITMFASFYFADELIVNLQRLGVI